MSDKIKIRSVQYNFVMNTILKMSSFLFPLITFPYISRVLGVALNGKIAFSTSYVQYFVMFAQLGIPNYGIRACARVRDNKQELSKTVFELLIINSFMVIISYCSLLITVFTIPHIIENRALVLISSVSVILTCVGMEWFYQAIEQYDYITYRNIAFKIISVGLMFLLVHEPKDYIIYAGINVIGTVGSNILNFIRINKFVSFRTVKTIELKRHLRPIIVFFLFTVSALIYTSLDSVMLGFMTNEFEVGLYAASIKIRNILYQLVVSIGVVLLPRASYLIQNKEYDKFQNIIRTSIQFVSVMAIPLSIYFVLESKTSIMFIAGNEYIGAATAMMLVTPTIIFAGISNITGIQVLIPLGFEKYTVVSTCGGALADLVLNFIFIPKYGAAGAAFGTLVAEIVVLGIQIWLLYRNNLLYHIKMEWGNFLKICVSGMISGILLVLLQHTIRVSSNFLNLALSATVYFGSFIAILLIIRERIIYDYVVKYAKDIFSKVMKKIMQLGSRL